MTVNQRVVSSSLTGGANKDKGFRDFKSETLFHWTHKRTHNSTPKSSHFPY